MIALTTDQNTEIDMFIDGTMNPFHCFQFLEAVPVDGLSLINTVTCSAIHIMTVGHGPRQGICA